MGLLTATAMVAATSGSALTNKLARICYATLRDSQPYGEPARRPEKKIGRMSFAMAA